MPRPIASCAFALVGLVVGFSACADSSNSSTGLYEDQTAHSGQHQVSDGASEVLGDGADSKIEVTQEGFSGGSVVSDQYTGSSYAPLPIAQISIEMDDGVNPDEFPYEREWRSASMEVFLAGEVVHEGRAGIHVRGNTSRDFDKKSFALETWNANDEDLDVPLLGLPAEEDWILQGPFSDKTLIRNHLIYTLSNGIGRYAARTRFVELEINGEYRGVYVLMEKIKRDDNRVALPEGAALLKRDWVEGGENFVQTALCRDDLKVEWSDDISGVVDRLDSIEAEILDGDFSSIDLESFIDHMLLVEIGRNVDGYVLSTWITLSENDVLGMGPVWDYNGALGNASYFEAWRPEGWHYENPEFPADNPHGFCWYEALLESKAFREMREQRWRMHREGPWSDDEIDARIDEAVKTIAPAVERNFERWPLLGEVIWPNDVGAESRTTYADEVAYLRSWLQQRTAWIDRSLGN